METAGGPIALQIRHASSSWALGYSVASGDAIGMGLAVRSGEQISPRSEGRTIPIHYCVDDAEVAWRITDDEAIVLHADSSMYFGLNQSGTVLWAELAERSMSLDQLADWAATRFTETPNSLPQELATFIEQLQSGQLLREEIRLDEPDSDRDAKHAGQRLPWEPPTATAFGTLEKLILSGE